MLTSERDYVKDLPKLPGIATLINEGNHQEALAQLKTLGPDTKKEKSILLIRIRAAQASDEKEYTEVLEEFRKLYPKDPCVDLLSIDYYTLKKDYPKALASIDRLDKAVGGDPYLNVLRASLSELGADLPSALKFANRTIEEEPTMLNAYFYSIGISLKAEMYDETLATLKKQDQTFKMTYNDLKTVPEYAGFVKSPQYQQWLDYLAQKNSGQKPTPSPSKKARSSKAKARSRN